MRSRAEPSRYPARPDPKADAEWAGELTVTYEAFRDSGAGVHGGAGAVICGRFVGASRDFALAGLIMSPVLLALMAVIVIPFGCVSRHRRIFQMETENGEIEVLERYTLTGGAAVALAALAKTVVTYRFFLLFLDCMGETHD